MAFGIKQIERSPTGRNPATVKCVDGHIRQTKPKNTGQFGPNSRPGKPEGRDQQSHTCEFKTAVQKLLEQHADNVGTWLVQVAQGHGEQRPTSEGSGLAGRSWQVAAPSWGRVEHTQQDSGPMKPSPALSWWT